MQEIGFWVELNLYLFCGNFLILQWFWVYLLPGFEYVTLSSIANTSLPGISTSRFSPQHSWMSLAHLRDTSGHNIEALRVSGLGDCQDSVAFFVEVRDLDSWLRFRKYILKTLIRSGAQRMVVPTPPPSLSHLQMLKGALLRRNKLRWCKRPREAILCSSVDFLQTWLLVPCISIGSAPLKIMRKGRIGSLFFINIASCLLWTPLTSSLTHCHRPIILQILRSIRHAPSPPSG